MKRLITFKHWQLFLLLVLTSAWTSPSPLKEIVHAIGLVTFISWIYAIGIYGQEKVEALGLPILSTKLFKTNILLIPLLTIIVFLLLPQLPTDESQTKFTLNAVLLIPTALYLVFALLQTTVFASKTLTTLELEREATFGDYALNLILVGFLIIGVWILQPKVTRLIASNQPKLV